MALQNTGTIGKGQLRTEFAGPTPSPLSQYYRGGTYVPASNPDTTNPPIPGYTACMPDGGLTQSFNNQANGAEMIGYCQGAGPGDVGTYDDYFTTMQCGGGGGGRNPAGSFSVGCQNAQSTNVMFIQSGCSDVKIKGLRELHSDGRFVYYYTQCNVSYGGTLTTNPPIPGSGTPGTDKNLGVPTSGNIKLSNFYGAEK